MNATRALLLLLLALLCCVVTHGGEPIIWGLDGGDNDQDGYGGDESHYDYGYGGSDSAAGSGEIDSNGEQSAFYDETALPAEQEEGGSDAAQEEVKNVISFDLKYFAPFRNENKFISFILTVEEGAISTNEKIADLSYKICTSHLKIDPDDEDHVNECVEKIFNCTVRIANPAAPKFCIVIQDDKLIKDVQNDNYMVADIVLVNNTVVSMDSFSFKTMLGNTSEQLFVYIDNAK